MKRAVGIRAFAAAAISVLAVFAAGAVLLISAGAVSLVNTLAAFAAGILIAATVYIAAFSTSLERRMLRPVRRAVEAISGVGAAERLTRAYNPQDEHLPAELAALGELSEELTEKLVEMEKHQASIQFTLNNMNEGLIVLDSELRIELINKSALSLFFSSEDVRGKYLPELSRRPELLDAAQQALCGGRSAFDLESGERTLQVMVSPVRGDGLRVKTRAILLITDVTAVRKAESIRSEFVANVSHELKTPLTSIKGYTELMESGMVKEPERQTRYLALIRSETDRMIMLINDILELSMLESVTADPGKKQCGLRAVAQKVAESLSVQAKEHEVEITVEGEEGLIQANPDRMTELILNLADNAVKYNRPGGMVRISIAEAENGIILTVSDTGVGIPEEAQERVFERFYRVDKGRSRRQGGTGLGLSIVKHIVGLYHGSIRLESRPGEGTTISVTLPSGNPETVL